MRQPTSSQNPNGRVLTLDLEASYFRRPMLFSSMGLTSDSTRVLFLCPDFLVEYKFSCISAHPTLFKSSLEA